MQTETMNERLVKTDKALDYCYFRIDIILKILYNSYKPMQNI